MRDPGCSARDRCLVRGRLPQDGCQDPQTDLTFVDLPFYGLPGALFGHVGGAWLLARTSRML